MADRQAVTLYDEAGGVGFVVSGSVPPFTPNDPRDALLYNGRWFVRDGDVDEHTLRYRAATTYAMVDEDTEPDE